MRAFVKILLIVGCWLPVSVAGAETKVTVSGTHLCCPACFKAVDAALTGVKGVKHESSKKDKSITVTADNDEAAQKAIDALAAAGFHGKLDNPKLRFKPVKPPQGKVTRVEVSGVHNCCGACCKAIKEAVAKVDGVQADTAKPKQTSFVVEGNFSAAELVEALLNAGFHGQVKE